MKECYHFFFLFVFYGETTKVGNIVTLYRRWMPELGHLQKVGHLYDGQNWVIYRRWVIYMTARAGSFTEGGCHSYAPSSGVSLGVRG
jgi:hypothetical protein